ncbi:hypothetical protein chiPu_0028278 [Chiloscyllium punctatum]|uniref:Uncharacterized protein n=1 Tax=Chiloscyllium punctatum TaxID=137246 RepID=A0A401TN01_CHIPU|nr:hypothetical protein [Chiloscyllium punctatum]
MKSRSADLKFDDNPTPGTHRWSGPCARGLEGGRNERGLGAPLRCPARAQRRPFCPSRLHPPTSRPGTLGYFERLCGVVP